MKRNEVNVFWFVNHCIPRYHDIVFIEPDENGNDRVICQQYDLYYIDHKPELMERVISFFTLDRNKINIYLKGEK